MIDWDGVNVKYRDAMKLTVTFLEDLNYDIGWFSADNDGILYIDTGNTLYPVEIEFYYPNEANNSEWELYIYDIEGKCRGRCKLTNSNCFEELKRSVNLCFEAYEAS